MKHPGASNSKQGEQNRGVSRWGQRTGPHHQPRSYRYLFDLDVDLAEELDLRMRLAARPSVTAMTFEGGPGRLSLSDWLALASPGPGVLVVDGVLAIDVHVADRVATELVGAGDLIQPWSYEDAELVGEIGWKALVPTRFALLDAAFAERVQPWPQINLALIRRAGRRTRRLSVQRAITAQPRLEVRLALLMWHLALRWGKVEPGGIRLSLPLTHQLLGYLISAERPSVSHALARLAESGLVTGTGAEWHLRGSVDDHLASMIEPPGTRVEQLIGHVATPMRSS